LTNVELGLCHETVTIPTDSAHSSLNLAQAVLVIAYELFLSARTGAAGSGDGAAPAPSGALEEALDSLREGLLSIGYLNSANPEPLLSELRRMLSRARPSLREASLLRGMAR